MAQIITPYGNSSYKYGNASRFYGTTANVNPYAYSVPYQSTQSQVEVNAISLNGVSDYASIPASSFNASDWNGAVTVAFWVFLTPSTNGGNMPFFDNIWGTTNNVGGFQFYIDNGGNVHAITCGTGTVGQDNVITPLPLVGSYTSYPNGRWVHLVLTKNVSTTTQTLYVNGSLNIQSTSTLYGCNPPTTALYLGTGNTKPSYLKTEFTNILIWNRALSSNEVSQVYSGRYPSSGLIHKWDFPEGSGFSISDAFAGPSFTINTGTWTTTAINEFASYSDRARIYGLTNAKQNYMVSGNTLLSQPTGTSAAILLSNTNTYANFSVEVSMNLLSENAQGGIVFRAQDRSNYYLFLAQAGTYNTYLCKVIGGIRFIVDQTTLMYVAKNTPLSIRVTASGGWLSVDVGNQRILSGYDTQYIQGAIGFYSLASMQFADIIMPQLWQPVQGFTVNPGDDLSQTLNNLAIIQQAYYRINYQDSLTVSVPSSSDASIYSYYDEIFSNEYKLADENVYNYVIVYGANGTSGAAFDPNSLLALNMKPRIETITDETLTTNEQCTIRAQRELAIVQRYANQPNIETPVNVGLELYDVVNVQDDDTGLNNPFRVMDIETTYDASDGQFSHKLGLSNP